MNFYNKSDRLILRGGVRFPPRSNKTVDMDKLSLSKRREILACQTLKREKKNSTIETAGEITGDITNAKITNVDINQADIAPKGGSVEAENEESTNEAEEAEETTDEVPAEEVEEVSEKPKKSVKKK